MICLDLVAEMNCCSRCSKLNRSKCNLDSFPTDNLKHERNFCFCLKQTEINCSLHYKNYCAFWELFKFIAVFILQYFLVLNIFFEKWKISRLISKKVDAFEFHLLHEDAYFWKSMKTSSVLGQLELFFRIFSRYSGSLSRSIFVKRNSVVLSSRKCIVGVWI